MKLIDKSALAAEIEREVKSIKPTNDYAIGRRYELGNLMSFLNTLEVKEVEKPTASDRGMVEEIIINLKRVEQDYHIDLTREMEWLRNLMKKGEPVNRTPADIESAMQEVEEKSKAFTEAHQGEDTDTILAQMRGEEPVSNDLEEASRNYADNEEYGDDVYYAIKAAFKEGAKWQKGKTLSDIKKAVTGKVFQFSMKNVEAWGDDSDGKTVILKGRETTFQVSNPESIVDALIKELENDN